MAQVVINGFAFIVANFLRLLGGPRHQHRCSTSGINDRALVHGPTRWHT
jgi:hypothetical protein